MPIQDNPIVAWKFCHLLHKVLREGHPNVLTQSLKHKSRLCDFGKLWGHLKEGYGTLIARYCSLLITKLDFHSRNPRFPGNLQVTQPELESIGENDINNYFQMSVEMFDYMDDILNLQSAVFGSLDMSRSNSMTSSGQCRLAPLIPCIQDSSQLYDYCVKILFKLHASLPSDTLSGHRNRFLKQFKDLRQFYLNTSNLQYFKNLIQIPLLPDSPPNFLIQAELRSYVTPVVVMPEQSPVAEQHDSLEASVSSESTSLVDLLDLSPAQSEPTVEHNGRSYSPDLLAQRDQFIAQLQGEVTRYRGESQRVVQQHHKIVQQITEQLETLESRLVQKEQELERERQNKEDLLKRAEAAARAQEVEAKARERDEKFQKLKEVYSNLRKEHIALLRKKAEVEKALGAAQARAEQLQRGQTQAEERLQTLISERSSLEEGLQQSASEKDSAIAQLEAARDDALREASMVSQRLERALTEKSSLEAEVHDLLAQKMEVEEKLEEAEQASRQREAQLCLDAENNMNAMLESCARQAELMVRNALEEMDNPALSTLTCSPGYLRDVCSPTELALTDLGTQLDLFRAQDGEVTNLSAAITQAAHTFAWVLLLGKAVSQSATDIEIGDAMLDQCRQGGTVTVSLLSQLSSRSTWGNAGATIATVKQHVQSLLALAERLEGRSAPLESVADAVENELATMEKAIEEAAAKIEEMLTKSRQADSGVKLEVNEKILDACTGLMAAVRQLVITSRKLQAEIVAQGKGTASAKEFYKRNHQWTEGLISAAKAVAIGAHFLLEAADEAVSGKGKLELLMVAAQQIAAGTAQLVVASRVKADRDSKNLNAVSQASKGVSHATGAVVAAAKACQEMVESADDQLDVSGLSLHRAKRLEMDSQVRVLELEASLQQERLRLAALRRHHYQLAGEAEGWEKKDIPE